MSNNDIEIKEDVKGEICEFLCSVPKLEDSHVQETLHKRLQKYLYKQSSPVYQTIEDKPEISDFSKKKISFLSIFAYTMKESISKIDYTADSLKLKLKFNINRGYNVFFKLFIKDKNEKKESFKEKKKKKKKKKK